jgi:hypothetical protein
VNLSVPDAFKVASKATWIEVNEDDIDELAAIIETHAHNMWLKSIGTRMKNKSHVMLTMVEVL